MDEQVTERALEFDTSRNGYRNRSFQTIIAGTIELKIPKLCCGTYWPKDVIKRWCRVDTALAAGIREMRMAGSPFAKLRSLLQSLTLRTWDAHQSRDCVQHSMTM